MQLLSEGRPEDPIQEELDLKEESEDEMMLQDRAIEASHFSSQRKKSSLQERPAVQPTVPKTSKPQLQPARPGDEKLSDAHVNRILHILDRTGGWERLAQHTNHGSLVRLYKKMKSPSKALFVKIRVSLIFVFEFVDPKKKLLLFRYFYRSVAEPGYHSKAGQEAANRGTGVRSCLFFRN